MPHLALIVLSGFRAREPDMLALGMTLPGLHDRAQAIAALPSLALLTLAALTPPHWSLSYHDPARVDDALINSIVAERPTLVAISALTASILDAYTLADALRRENIRVVLGGLHVTVLPDEAAQHADAIVLGDAEPVWPDVLRDAERNALRPRYRADKPFDFAHAPVPRFDLVAHKPRPRYTIQTQRGCPLACDFCAASRVLGPFREKPAERVEAELLSLSSLARRPLLELADDNTFAGRRDPAPLLVALERSGARWFTESDWRIGERPDLLARLAPAGCVQVLIGIESFAMRHPGMGAKAAPQERILRAIDNIQSAGVAAIGCFILGADGEDHDSLQSLADFLDSANFSDIQLTIATPFPGSPLRARLERQGRLLKGRSYESCTLFDVAFQPDRLSVEQLERAFVNLCRHAFSAEPTSRRAAIRQSIWSRRGDAAA